MKKPSIGFVGMGVMGAPMAMHLAKAGYKLVIYDIQRQAAEKVAAEAPDIMLADTPAGLAAQSEIVVTMVPNGRIVREITLGAAGLIEGFKEGALLLDTSSSEPWITMETAGALAQKGIEMVDAPVSGARAGAEAAELVFMVGADRSSLERVRPLLAVMGQKIFHLGAVGCGHMMKCINNLVTAMTFMATAEGLTIGKQFGLDPEVMTDVLNVSTGMSWISQTQFRQRIFNRKFDDPFKLALMVKDIGIAMGLAESQGIPLPLSSVGHHLWRAAVRHAEPGASISDMVHWVESMTGIELAGRAAESDEAG
jgi:3-hydroxyisobutyrate dehydrogenase